MGNDQDNKATCEMWGCDSVAHSYGLCMKHLVAARKAKTKEGKDAAAILAKHYRPAKPTKPQDDAAVEPAAPAATETVERTNAMAKGKCQKSNDGDFSCVKDEGHMGRCTVRDSAGNKPGKKATSTNVTNVTNEKKTRREKKSDLSVTIPDSALKFLAIDVVRDETGITVVSNGTREVHVDPDGTVHAFEMQEVAL